MPRRNARLRASEKVKRRAAEKFPLCPCGWLLRARVKRARQMRAALLVDRPCRGRECLRRFAPVAKRREPTSANLSRRHDVSYLMSYNLTYGVSCAQAQNSRTSAEFPRKRAKSALASEGHCVRPRGRATRTEWVGEANKPALPSVRWRTSGFCHRRWQKVVRRALPSQSSGCAVCSLALAREMRAKILRGIVWRKRRPVATFLSLFFCLLSWEFVSFRSGCESAVMDCLPCSSLDVIVKLKLAFLKEIPTRGPSSLLIACAFGGSKMWIDVPRS